MSRPQKRGENEEKGLTLTKLALITAACYVAHKGKEKLREINERNKKRLNR